MGFAGGQVKTPLRTQDIRDRAVTAAKLSYGGASSVIGTRTLRNVNLPWALGGGLAVSSGTLQTRGTTDAGTLGANRLILQSPIRAQGGSVGLGTVRASKLGYGSTASAIGTRTLRNVNLPWALGGGFAVVSGTLQTQGTLGGGTVRANRLILQSPVRAQAAGGSVGLGTVRAGKLGYGSTASAIGTRTLRNVNLPWALGGGLAVSSGTLQTQGTTVGTVRATRLILQSPVRASAGSVGLGTVRAGKLGYGSTASAIGTRTLRNVNLPWAFGGGLAVSSGTLQTQGTTTGGTIRATRLILQSPVRQEAAGGSVGLGTVRAGKLGYGSTASAIGTRTLRNVNLPWALGQGFTVSSGTIQTRGTAAGGTVNASQIGSYAIQNRAFDIKTWLYSRQHSWWEGWLDRKRAARNTMPGGIGLGSFARLEYGGMGISSLAWAAISTGSWVFPSSGTAYIVLGANAGVSARGTYARWTILDYAFGSFPANSPMAFRFAGTFAGNMNVGTYFGFHLTRGSAGTMALVSRTAGATTYVVSGTANQGRGVRRSVAAFRTGGGSWVLLADKGADSGWRVVGSASNTATPTAFTTSIMSGVAGSVRVFRAFQSAEGR